MLLTHPLLLVPSKEMDRISTLGVFRNELIINKTINLISFRVGMAVSCDKLCILWIYCFKSHPRDEKCGISTFVKFLKILERSFNAFKLPIFILSTWKFICSSHHFFLSFFLGSNWTEANKVQIIKAHHHWIAIAYAHFIVCYKYTFTFVVS